MRKDPLIVTVLLAWMILLPTGWGTLITFDDLAGKPVPDDYGGLDWVDPVRLENKWVVDPNHLPQNPSPCALLYTGDTVVEATISSADPIDFLGIRFAGQAGDRVQIVGYNPLQEYSFSKELDGSEMFHYDRQWLGITSLTVCFDMLYPGSTTIDDLAFEPSPRLATIYTEDFESFNTDEDLLTAGWELRHGQYPATDGGIWHVDLTRSLDGQGVTSTYLISNSDAEGELPPLQYLDESLLSPEIDCTEFTEVRLVFRQNITVYDEENPDEVFNVHVSSDPAHQNWESNWTPLWREQDGDWFYPRSIDISDFAAGKKIKIRWRYTANFDYWWAIDDVKLIGRPNVLEVASLQVNAAAREVSIAWDAPDGLFTIEASGDSAFFIAAELATEISEKQWTGTDPGMVSSGQRFYRVRMD